MKIVITKGEIVDIHGSGGVLLWSTREGKTFHITKDLDEFYEGILRLLSARAAADLVQRLGDEPEVKRELKKRSRDGRV
jgi:hypothetical protein